MQKISFPAHHTPSLPSPPQTASTDAYTVVDGTAKHDQQFTQQPLPLDHGEHSTVNRSDDFDEEQEAEVEAKKSASVRKWPFTGSVDKFDIVDQRVQMSSHEKRITTPKFFHQ
jgi:hypothetical protein